MAARILGFYSLVNKGGYEDGEWVGREGCISIEEVMLPGPNGPVPYIRRHAAHGYADHPKHNLVFISYSTE